MVVYLRSGGRLRDKLAPDVDQYTRRIDIEGNPTLGEILTAIGIEHVWVAFGYAGGEIKRLSYRPNDGDVITLQPPVAGG